MVWTDRGLFMLGQLIMRFCYFLRQTLDITCWMETFTTATSIGIKIWICGIICLRGCSYRATTGLLPWQPEQDQSRKECPRASLCPSPRVLQPQKWLSGHGQLLQTGEWSHSTHSGWPEQVKQDCSKEKVRSQRSAFLCWDFLQWP